MTKSYITIDGGTTNTRISLVTDNKVITTLKFGIGARIGIDNSTEYKETIKNGIIEILKKNNLTENEIISIIASGMITSEFGLVNLPHIKTPAGIEELNSNMYKTMLPEISPIQFVFIRGVKTDCESLESADMMRGEETELMGILENGESIYILPGSHSKIIHTDKNGKINDFKTMLTGEMIMSISQNTILKDAVDIKNSETNKEYLLKGYNYCSQFGINEALFKVRVLKNLFGENSKNVYSFYLGIILCDEIKSILKASPEKIVIGGKKQIKDAMHTILSSICESKIISLSDNEVDNSSALGAVKIFEYNN